MTADEIRLECLKLAHRHDKSPDEIVGNAKVFEEYVSASRTLSVNPKEGRDLETSRLTAGKDRRARRP